MIGKQYLIPLLACTDTVDDIRPDKLPDYPVIIKATHTSGGELIVTNKSDVNWKKARSHFRRLLKENYYFRTKEYPYKKISPRLVVERLLLDEHGVIPNDFKFHCFHGRVKFIQVDTDRHSNHCRNLYDPDWNVL